MITYRIEEIQSKVAESITCDCCKKTFLCDFKIQPDCYEVSNFLRISYQGGYGSVFGDGAEVFLDMCQHCFKNILGPFSRSDEKEWGNQKTIPMTFPRP